MLTSKTHHDELDELQKPPLAHQQRMSRTEAAKKVLEGQRVVLARLRAWHQWEVDNRKSLFKYILSKLGYLRRPRCPDDADLVSLGTYFFPPRSLLKVTVCDFGHERAVRSTASLGAIEERKPLALGLSDLEC